MTSPSPLLLLIGGVSESVVIATALVDAGYRVLMSRATDVPFTAPKLPNVAERVGRLDVVGMSRLIAEQNILLTVDASHPYAIEIKKIAHEAAASACIPYVRWIRPPGIPQDVAYTAASDHEQAAKIAFSFGRPVLLTTGSRNLAPYAEHARAEGILLIARVLDHRDSLAAAAAVGIPPRHVVAGRGPFSLVENLALLDKFHIGTLVTKDGGIQGGMAEKLQAAQLRQCHVVVVSRPQIGVSLSAGTVTELVSLVAESLKAVYEAAVPRA